MEGMSYEDAASYAGMDTLIHELEHYPSHSRFPFDRTDTLLR
jgi:hypothetical protein